MTISACFSDFISLPERPFFFLVHIYQFNPNRCRLRMPAETNPLTIQMYHYIYYYLIPDGKNLNRCKP
jgi:hypothetical protein